MLPAAAPEPRPTRPVQVGGASSSSGPAGGRQPRAIEVDPRAPYRRFPNEQKVRFEDNPGRPGGPRFVRFEKTKWPLLLGGSPIGGNEPGFEYGRGGWCIGIIVSHGLSTRQNLLEKT